MGLGFLLLACGLFAAIGIWGARSVRGLEDFFHFRGVGKNVLALVVANITLGNGIAYLFAAGGALGAVILVLPLALVAGYALVGWLVSRWASPALFSGGSLFAAAAREIGRATGSRSMLVPMVVGPLALAYLFVLAYELFASSQIISAFLGGPANGAPPVLVGALLFVGALVYTVAGGAQSVYRSDLVQFAAILAFAGIVLLGAMMAPEVRWVLLPQMPLAMFIITLLALVVNTVATQTFSLLNWYLASNLEATPQIRTAFLGGAVTTSAFFAVIALVGLGVPGPWGTDLAAALTLLLEPLRAYGVVADVAFYLVAFGLLSIVLSSADTLMIAVAMFVLEARQSLRAHQPGDPSEDISATLFTIRAAIGIGFLVMFAFLGWLYYFRANLFYMLLGIAGGAAAYAPLVWALLRASRHRLLLERFTNKRLAIYPVLSLLGLLCAMFLNLRAPEFVALVPVFSVVISSIFSYKLLMRVG
ncbi:MAG: hypothetical protein KatS3mg082_3384 [Nitrospiraceae bacterium]|nr:MAG: hypothetical protein KatS3mg082_3384 [Nitrospiraceae bacterium]